MEGEKVMAEILKSWRIWLLVAVLFLAVGLIAFNGLKFGIDFEGGTLFQIHLSEKVESMETVTQVIESRLNWSGLKDMRIYGAENEFVFVIVPETNEEDVKRIESLIRKQGNFEVMIDGNMMLSGEGIINVDQDPSLPAFERIDEETFIWRLPFVLKLKAAEKFRNLSFHKCPLINFENSEYNCSLTYFYIDRPKESILVFSQGRFDEDRRILLNGTEKIPKNTEIQDLLLNSGAPQLTVIGDSFSEEQLTEINSLAATNKFAVVQAELSDSIKQELTAAGFALREVESTDADQDALKKIPWIYTATNLKSIVRLQPSITGNNPYVESPEDARVITDLFITGQESSFETVQAERNETKILLSSGSLPVSVESISHFWTSPTQGKEFLVQAALIGIMVLLTVSAIIFIRYRRFKLAMAIMFTALVEAFVTMSFTSSLGQSIDLAAIAGIIAAVGTGVDDQIIITDELLKGEEEEHASLVRRVKRAFFIVMAAAATTLATMVPIIIFGYVMVKLAGFAIAITIGVLVGIFVTRPAFGEIAKYLMGEY